MKGLNFCICVIYTSGYSNYSLKKNNIQYKTGNHLIENHMQYRKTLLFFVKDNDNSIKIQVYKQVLYYSFCNVILCIYFFFYICERNEFW